MSVHGVAPVYLQRGIFIVILSFLFFLAMMFVYYIRQSMGYFLLASAFLVVYLVTLFSWVMQRRHVVKIHENGVSYKNRSALWSEIDNIDNSGTISVRGEKPIMVPKIMHDTERLISTLRQQCLQSEPPG